MRSRHPCRVAIPLLALLAAGVLGCAASRLAGRAAPTPVPRPPRDEAAIRQFELARELAEFEAARACWRRGDGPGCQGRLEHLLARNPEQEDGRLLMAEMLSSTGRPQEAAAHLQRLIAMHPDNARAQYALGRLSTAQGQFATAAACFERAARLQPDNQQYVASYRHAVIVARNPAAASPRAETASSSSGGLFEPAGTAAIPRRSPAAGLDGTASPASFTAPVGQLGSAAEPKDAAPAVAAAYYRRGEYEAARAVLEQALALDRSNAQIHYLMGCTLIKLGERERAESHLDAARRLDPRYSVN